MDLGDAATAAWWYSLTVTAGQGEGATTESTNDRTGLYST